MSPRILVADDQPTVAYAVCDLIADAGFDVVGPAASVADALTMLRLEGCDAALVDFRLSDTTAELLITSLRDGNVPYIIFTGCMPDELPPSYRSDRFLLKPVGAEAVIAALQALKIVEPARFAPA